MLRKRCLGNKKLAILKIKEVVSKTWSNWGGKVFQRYGLSFLLKLKTECSIRFSYRFWTNSCVWWEISFVRNFYGSIIFLELSQKTRYFKSRYLISNFQTQNVAYLDCLTSIGLQSGIFLSFTLSLSCRGKCTILT